MPRNAADLARRLAREAEAVCRHYLSNGRRVGNYWLVGDVRNTPGRSMFVRLTGADIGKGPAGKWTDAATGEHGDLLDVIRESCGLVDFRDVADEARRFLACRDPSRNPAVDRACQPAPTGSPEAARRLFAMSQPIAGTLVETYLRGRGITDLARHRRLRFHPRCYYRPDDDAPTETWPALIAAVTDLDGPHHRRASHLARSGRRAARRRSIRHAGPWVISSGTASVSVPPGDVMAAGEGIETMLSLRCVMPDMPMVAALSAAHLAAILFPATLRRLYIVRDDDPAGDGAVAGLFDRAQAAGIEAMVLSPQLGGLQRGSPPPRHRRARAALRIQLAPEDVTRFLSTSGLTGIGDEARTLL